jgi:pilus assembly protein Flp/PilA
MKSLKQYKNKNLPFARRALRAVAGESGATFVEYAMLAGLVAIVVAVAVALFGSKLKSLFTSISKQVEDVDGTVKGTKIEGPEGSSN